MSQLLMISGNENMQESKNCTCCKFAEFRWKSHPDGGSMSMIYCPIQKNTNYRDDAKGLVCPEWAHKNEDES